jgi:hypothetical protein
VVDASIMKGKLIKAAAVAALAFGGLLVGPANAASAAPAPAAADPVGVRFVLYADGTYGAFHDDCVWELYWYDGTLIKSARWC